MAQSKGSTKTLGNPIAGSMLRGWTANTSGLDRRYPAYWGYVDGSDAAQTVALNAQTLLPALTASRNITLPVINAKWDRCSVSWPTGSTTLSAVILTGAGNTCMMPGRAVAVAASSEITRLFNPGESIAFVAYSSTAWMLDIGGDGRKACFALMYLSTASTGEAPATPTYPTDASGVWTSSHDSGGMITTATGAITARRVGRAHVRAIGRSNSAITDGNYFNVDVTYNTTSQETPVTYGAPSVTLYGIPAQLLEHPMAVGDTLRLRYRSLEGSKGLAANVSVLSYLEILG